MCKRIFLLVGKNGKDLILGDTITCPGFYGPQGRELRLKPGISNMMEKLSQVQIHGIRLSNFEMETAGYYAMGRLLGHEVLSLNAILVNRISNDFYSNPDQIMERLIVHTLERL